MLRGIGIGATSVGGASILYGLMVGEFSQGRGKHDTSTVGIGMIVGGFVLAGAGIVMILVGGKKVPVTTAANGICVTF